MLEKIETLEELWQYCDSLHEKNFPKSKLRPIMGNGKAVRPNYMFVFINPTYRNITSSSEWDGFRAPWIGTKYIWKIFNAAGHFDSILLEEIQKKKDWSTEFAKKVYSHIASKGFYFTNLVKWTGENADLPNKEKINLFLPLLLKETEIVKPKHVVTLGLMPFNALLDVPLKLGDYYNKVIENEELEYYDFMSGNHNTKVIPCYFPVGRGNPKRATEILKML